MIPHHVHAPFLHSSAVLTVGTLLVSEATLDALAKRYGALPFVAVLGMITAQGDKLLADVASWSLRWACLRVRNNLLHLCARRVGTLSVGALACMYEGIDAFLDRLLLLIGWSGTRSVVRHAKAEFLHGMLVLLFLVASSTEIVIRADCSVGAMVTIGHRSNVFTALVASVAEIAGVTGVQ